MSGLRAAARAFVYSHFGANAAVLIYHRVALLESDPQALAVRPEHFSAHMETLARDYVPVPLATLIDGLARRRIEDRTVAVTFDDGYADNLTAAAPILAAHGIPATVFVSSGFLDGTREFWWDELERLLLRPRDLPARIEIAVDGGRFVAEIGSATWTRDEWAAFDSWSVLDPSDPTPRHTAYRRLCAFVRPLSAAGREDALAQLRAAAGLAERTPRSSHAPLGTVQVTELDALGGVDIGAHTVNHTVLAALDDEAQRGEIRTSKDVLSKLCGRPVSTFSYPYGGPADYTPRTTALVREAGFVGACANHPGVVKPWTDAFRIPRILVRDWDGERFGREMKSWFDEPR